MWSPNSILGGDGTCNDKLTSHLRPHDVGLGCHQLPGPEGEVPVAAPEAMDHRAWAGPLGTSGTGWSSGSSGPQDPCLHVAQPLSFGAVTMPGHTPPLKTLLLIACGHPRDLMEISVFTPANKTSTLEAMDQGII